MGPLGGLDPLLEKESPVGILSFARDGRILDTNPALLRFLGSPSKEVTSRINVLAYVPLVQAGIAGDFRRALEEKAVVSAERDYTSRWGKTLHGRITVLPVLDADGNVAGAQALVEDRTASWRAEELLRVQRDLGVALASAGSAQSALERILDAALEVEGIDCGGVYVTEGGGLRLQVQRRLPEAFAGRTLRCGPDAPLASLVAAGEAVFRKWTELPLPEEDAVGGEGLRAIAVVPARHGGQVVGALTAASRSEDEIPLRARNALQAIASRVGSVLALARAEGELLERERFLSLLSGITTRTLESTEIDVLLGPVADEIAALFGCDACFVSGWDDATGLATPLAASGQRSSGYREVAPLPGERTIAATVLETGRPVVVEDTRDSPAIGPRPATTFPFRSALGLPLLARGERLGAIVLAWTALRRCTPREVAAGEQAAAQISLALSRAGLSDQERQRAVADPVTGLLTRRGLQEPGTREVLRAVRFGRPLHALLLEVDRLPEIRESHGSAVADSILRAASRRSRAAVRDVDILSRGPGDALCVLLSETGAEELARISERLRSAVAEGPFPTPAGDFVVSASIGICPAGPETPDLAALLAGAEAALTAARSEGGDRTVLRS